MGRRESGAHSSAMTAAAVPAQPALVSRNEDEDLSAAFGALFTALPKELLAKIVPAERTVMLRRVSKGARSEIGAARPAAVVKARSGGGRIAGLEERLHGMMSWCVITVLDLARVALRPADVETSLERVLGQCSSLAHLDLRSNGIG